MPDTVHSKAIEPTMLPGRKQPWIWVRVYGELKIINRVSYVTLLIVPLLAGAWPAVRIAVNRYNESARASAERLEKAASTLRAESMRIAPQVSLPVEVQERYRSIQASLNQLENDTAAALEHLAPRTLHSPLLPWSWAVSFYAALCVVLGHLVYEARAPQPFRAQGRDQFVQSRVLDFRENGSQAKLARADHYLELTTGKPPVASAVADQPERIERGAFAEYAFMAGSERTWAWVSLLLFASGLLLALLVVARQCYSVAEAAGWVS